MKRTMPRDTTIEDLGIDEACCVKMAAEIINLAYPTNHVIVGNKFYTKVFSDGSGSFNLQYIVDDE